jgi:hypothetical protein
MPRCPHCLCKAEASNCLAWVSSHSANKLIDDTNEHTQNSNAIPKAQHSSCCFKFEWGCHCHLQGYHQSAYYTCCSALPEGQNNLKSCTVWDLGGMLANFVHHATCLLPTALASRNGYPATHCMAWQCRCIDKSFDSELCKLETIASRCPLLKHVPPAAAPLSAAAVLLRTA